MNTDTPLPPDEATAPNPPDGAVVDYYLSAPAGPVKLEILDAAGKVIRHYSSDDPVEAPDPMLNVPTYWVRPPQTLSNAAGLHRFLWDLHYQPLTRGRAQLPIAAVFRNTAPPANSPWVAPGVYKVRLTAGGETLTESITVKMDPRVHNDVTTQSTLSRGVYTDVLDATSAMGQMRELREKIRDTRAKAGAGATTDALTSLDQKVQAIQGNPGGGGRGGGGRGAAQTGPDTMASVSATLAGLMQSLQEADAPPTTQEAAAIAQKRAALADLMRKWKAIQASDLPAINKELAKARIPALEIEEDAVAVGMDDDDDDDDIG
jgi:hypothetical protein